jgi:hypothetical protein
MQDPLREALRWCLNEIDMRCDPAIPSVKQAADRARAALAASPSREAPAAGRFVCGRCEVRGTVTTGWYGEVIGDGVVRFVCGTCGNPTGPLVAAPASREAPGDLAAVEKLTGPLDADRWYIEARVGSANHRGDVVRFINDRRSAAGGGYWNAPAHEVFASLLSAVARLSRNEGTALAPWYEADGSTVMLPVAEVERRRKLAAKVLREARLAVEQCGHPILAAALRALDAASPPPPTPGAKP